MNLIDCTLVTLDDGVYIATSDTQNLQRDDRVIPRDHNDQFSGHVHSVCYGEAIVVCANCGISHIERYMVDELYKVTKCGADDNVINSRDRYEDQC